MKYTIIRAGDCDTLETAVNEHIAEDWEPQGGVSVAIDCNPDVPSDWDPRELWCQAMVKR